MITKDLPLENSPVYKTLLLTGAAGGLGHALRTRLAPFCEQLRLSDLIPIHDLRAQEQYMAADLSHSNSVLRICEGVDAIVHLGGLSLEGPFEDIAQANIMGSYHIYEAARLHGIQRIVFASSNHVTGFYLQNQAVSPLSPRKPDGYYGISKSFTEDLASFYYDRYGIETLSIRIGSSFPEPKDRRMLSTWLSYDDLTRLIMLGLSSPHIQHQVIYGVSNNSLRWWLDTETEAISFQPKDSSDVFAKVIESQPPLPAEHPQRKYQGGLFTALGPYPFPMSSPIEAQPCVHTPNLLGESPIWAPLAGVVYWVDIELSRLHAYHPITKEHHYWQSTQGISAVFEKEADASTLWVCAHDGIYLAPLDWGKNTLELAPLALLKAPAPQMRLNDAVMDAMGRIWVTVMTTEQPLHPNNPGLGGLYCWDPQAPTELKLHLPNLKIGNGLAINPEQNRLYVSDSHPSRSEIYCYDFNLKQGSLQNKTVFSRLKPDQGRPDGAVMDEQGGYWICGIGAGVIHRFLPNGQLERSLYLPSQFPTKACFGRHHLNTLYITVKSAIDDNSSLALIEVQPGVKGFNGKIDNSNV